MVPKIVRTSKYRHLYGNGSKKENCFDGVQVSLDQNDWHLVKANSRYLSIDWNSAGGGSFLIWPLESVGKLPTGDDLPLFSGHAGPVLDTDFHPFNDFVVASAGDDGKVLLWGIPEGGPKEANNAPLISLTGHERRVVDLAWHPAAENVLASASHDLAVRVWDVIKGKCHLTLTGHSDAVIDQGWSLRGDLLLTSAKDKAVRVFDPRASDKPIAERPSAHAGVKGIRVTWLGEDNTKFITTGFGRCSEREIALWDARKLDGGFLHQVVVDTASGPLLPFYDADCGVLYVAGKGDGNIRYYEIVSEDPYFYTLGEYKSSDPQRGLAILPKRACSVSDNEIARFYKVYGSQSIIEPVSLKVPRRDHANFQSDIYPEALSDQPALTAEEFFDGKTKAPKRISLEAGFIPATQREMGQSQSGGDLSIISKSGASLNGFASSITNSASLDAIIQQNEPPKDSTVLKEAWSKLIKENEALRAELAQKNIKIRQLEAVRGSSTGSN